MSGERARQESPHYHYHRQVEVRPTAALSSWLRTSPTPNTMLQSPGGLGRLLREGRGQAEGGKTENKGCFQGSLGQTQRVFPSTAEYSLPCWLNGWILHSLFLRLLLGASSKVLSCCPRPEKSPRASHWDVPGCCATLSPCLGMRPCSSPLRGSWLHAA